MEVPPKNMVGLKWEIPLKWFIKWMMTGGSPMTQETTISESTWYDWIILNDMFIASPGYLKIHSSIAAASLAPATAVALPGLSTARCPASAAKTIAAEKHPAQHPPAQRVSGKACRVAWMARIHPWVIFGVTIYIYIHISRKYRREFLMDSYWKYIFRLYYVDL